MILKRSLAVITLAAFVAQQAGAATFSVTNASDSGAGSLRQAVTDSNTAGGTNTVAWSGGGGILSLLTDLPGIAANTTLDATSAASAVVLNGPGGIPLAGADTFRNASVTSWSIGSVISGAGSLTQTGGGLIILTGANTYSGGTFLNSGTLRVNADAALGTGALTFNGGTLQASAPVTSNKGVTLNAGGGTFDSNGSTITLSGIIGGTGALVKGGTGDLILTGVNTFAGGVSINGGNLKVSADSGLGDTVTGATVTFNGGTLQTAAGFTTARPIVLNGSGSIDTLGNAVTLSGTVSGSGNLNSYGAGTLTLSGVNTLTGNTAFGTGTLILGNSSALGTGVLTFNGGTMKAAVNLNLPNTMVLNTANDTIDTNGKTIISSGSIIGGGALNILGNGSLTLNGSNSYGGGTTFQTGTLNITQNSGLGTGALTFNGGTFQTGSTVTVQNLITLTGNGTFDTQGNASVISGVISGAGTLINASTGTLALTGVNTYTGGTTLNSGILNINNRFAAGTNAITINNGATLQVSNNFTLPNNIILGGGTGIYDTNSYNTTLSGVISGGGGLQKIGNGILTLTNNNTYTGATTVGGGVLLLGINNALPTGTALTVNAGCELNTSNFTQTVASLSNAGTTRMVLQSGVTNVTATGGAGATLTGGTLAVSLPAGTVVKAGEVFVPIKTTGGTLNGTTLSSIVSPAALSFTPTYNANNLTLTVSLVPFANSAASGNQASVGNALEPLRANPTGDNASVMAGLYGLNVPQLRSALDQIGPGSLAAMSGIGFAGASVQAASVSQRMAVLAENSPRRQFYLGGVTRRSAYPGTLVAQAGEADTPRADESPDSRSPWGFFASGSATAGRLNEGNNGTNSTPGYAFNSGGLTGGADYRFNENFAGGASLGYLHGHAAIYQPGSGTVDNNSFRYGLYATAFTERAHANVYAGGATDSFSTKRGIVFGQLNRTASASPTGQELNLNTSLSYDLRSVEYGIFSPFAGMNYDRLMIGSFTEDGAGTLNLSVGPQTAESLQSNVGLRYSMQFDQETRSFVPYASLAWRHEFQDQSRQITAQFSSGGGNPFTVTTGGYARNGTVVGMGLSASFGKYTVAKFDYGGDFRSHYQDSMFNLSVRLRF